MIDICGSRKLGHPTEAVFTEGLNSEHWAHDSDHLLISPRDEQIRAGGLIEIGFRLGSISVNYDATVKNCIANKHVAVEGEVPRFGDTSLSFDLAENEDGVTEVYFGFQGNFHKVSRLGRGAIETAVARSLRGKIDEYADTLTGKIDVALAQQNQALA